MNVQESTVKVFIRNDLGLHARPAAQLVQEANKFTSQIRLIFDDAEVDAKSILDILSLAATKGSLLTLKATGPDAQEAVVHLEDFFKNSFGED